MQDNETPGDEAEGNTLGATVLNLFTNLRAITDGPSQDDEEPDIDELAWIAKRLVRRALDTVDWTELAGGAAMVLDESDVALVRQLLTQVRFTIEIPGL